MHQHHQHGLLVPRLPCCLHKKLFIVPLGQVGGEILLLIQAYQESRGQEVVERDVGAIVVERGADLRTGEKLAADQAVFHAQDDSAAESGWGVANPRNTSDAEGEREHTAFAGLNSETDSSYSFLGSREPEACLDITVTPTDNGKGWNLTDLFGRPMGRITEASAEQFTIQPDGHALETMAGIEHRPFTSLDAALAAIERHTRGVCRHHSGEDRP